MLIIQTTILIFSFTFFAPQGTSTLNTTAASIESLSSGLAEIEAERCFHELNQEYVNSAIVCSYQQAYVELDLLTQSADGYQSEALGVSLGHLFYEDTADFLEYYLYSSSTDFKFLFLSELELSCEMESETEVQKLKTGWLAKIQSTDSTLVNAEALAELTYQIENI